MARPDTSYGPERKRSTGWCGGAQVECVQLIAHGFWVLDGDERLARSESVLPLKGAAHSVQSGELRISFGW